MGLLLFNFWDLLGPKSNPGPNIQNIIAKMNPGPKKMTNNLRKFTKNRPKMFETGPHSHQPVQAPRDQPLQVPGGAAVARRMASSIFAELQSSESICERPCAYLVVKFGGGTIWGNCTFDFVKYLRWRIDSLLYVGPRRSI